ncbi:hypothetical protein N658DRAFT_191015 [Parathielavia hyrcaniae]|uniref:RING-type domain-containing protein n=1 Tax=Parathielavia hyrcaniae TaxID=113614 RepID=A0AAN6Q9T2_9PEZI|nr:hypothetical protein N658DRAFT_191015 [Parathielavia hyrcaniae]
MGRTTHDETEVKIHTAASPATHGSTVYVEDRTCPICQEPTGTRNPDGVIEGWSELPCGHRFGSYCIKRYLIIAADEHPLCPICRQMAYHDVCGHPVLPFVLESCCTHHDLDEDPTVAAGALPYTPTREEELTTVACQYCRMMDELREHLANSSGNNNKKSGPLSTITLNIKAPFRWMRGLIPPVLRRRSVRIESLTRESSRSGHEHRLSRQEARTRRRIPPNSGPWHGPWMDVQSRDVEWEKWWKDQAPRGA